MFRPTFTLLENPLKGKDKNTKFLESTFSKQLFNLLLLLLLLLLFFFFFFLFIYLFLLLFFYFFFLIELRLLFYLLK